MYTRIKIITGKHFFYESEECLVHLVTYFDAKIWFPSALPKFIYNSHGPLFGPEFASCVSAVYLYTECFYVCFYVCKV